MHPDSLESIVQKTGYLAQLFGTMYTAAYIDEVILEKIEANKNEIRANLRLLKFEIKNPSDLKIISEISKKFNELNNAYGKFRKKYHEKLENNETLPITELKKLYRKSEELQDKCIKIFSKLEKEFSRDFIV
ncbi:MAG: hypothetical protein OH319_01680 [Candidatus Parvarchaeota archaeon]|nr:hypothetical protein [Candidatus Jingweiarchaeum tengchongense]MCW1304300.1 hypothetical protein [Candidatus Jingweiarchaeum tengchongense]MCW1309348.1 hypothetical protein [Candidatus Jingweiarchaeum tengchongense]MCW1311144.1 hypothetical protein [Candidatus Jingweiarchaeum tengchongense]